MEAANQGLTPLTASLVMQEHNGNVGWCGGVGKADAGHVGCIIPSQTRASHPTVAAERPRKDLRLD